MKNPIIEKIKKLRYLHGSIRCYIFGHNDVWFPNTGIHCTRCGMPIGWDEPPSLNIPARLTNLVFYLTRILPYKIKKLLKRS